LVLAQLFLTHTAVDFKVTLLSVTWWLGRDVGALA